jgi:outer membrane biosynthesis protein TonB
VLPLRTIRCLPLVVLIFLADGCSSHQADRCETVKADKADRASGVAAATPEPRQPRLRDCDFSKYRPLRVSSEEPWRKAAINRIDPKYPAGAKLMRLQGRVKVRLLIRGDGEVVQACADGPALLRDAAEEAALQWVFRPTKLNGMKVPYTEDVVVFDFVLDAAPGSGAHR